MLHNAALRDQTVVFRRLIKLAKHRVEQDSTYQGKKVIHEWVNRKTNDEEFTAIHYASFNGNLEICQMLLEEGADKYALNTHGLNCLHIAAQGDQPGSLYYFHKILNLNLTEKDHRSSTPLHWAVFSLSELAMIYILAWLSMDELS